MLVIEENDSQPIVVAAGQRGEWAEVCGRAEQLLDDQPDAAALLLDGLLLQIAREWEPREQRAWQAAPLRADEPAELLVRIEQAAPLIGWRLRLALRAPDARARLAACRALIDALSE